MIFELQSTLQASGIGWLTVRYHIQCVAHVTQLALGAFLSSLGVKGRTTSWEVPEPNQQFGENENIDIGRSLRLRKMGNATIIKMSAVKPGLANIIEKVLIFNTF
jgi:hypothetical protein